MSLKIERLGLIFGLWRGFRSFQITFQWVRREPGTDLL